MLRHFIAYHSAEAMGYEYEPAGSYVFHSSKRLAYLQRTIGSAVWAINGTRRARSGTDYTLRAVFFAEDVIDGEGSEFRHAVIGSLGLTFERPIPLNDRAWFSELYRAQNNFSLGINEIKHPACITGLLALAEGLDPGAFVRDSKLEIPFDVDELALTEAEEGMAVLATHLRRERNQSLVEAKKSEVRTRTGGLQCEVCDFDFAATYGAVGEGFCEVHHRAHLSAKSGPRVTKLADLAIVCSNCHRIIHRSRPALTVEALRKTLMGSASVRPKKTQRRAN